MLRYISRECRTYTKLELLWETLINLECDVKRVGGMWIQLLALLQRMDSCRRVHKILHGSVDGRMQRTALVGRLGGHATDTVIHQEEAWTLLDPSPPSPGLAQHLAHWNDMVTYPALGESRQQGNGWLWLARSGSRPGAGILLAESQGEKNFCEDFPGGSEVENPPASAGDTGSIPGLERSHMPQGN